MLFAKYIIKDRLIRLEKISNKIKENQEDINTEKSNIFSIIYDLRLALEECKCGFKRATLYNLMSNSIKHYQRALNNIETAESLKNLINEINSMFADLDLNEFCHSDFTSEYRNMESFRRIDLLALDPIKKICENVHRNINAFEIDCGNGDRLEYLSQGNNSILTYGNEMSLSSTTAKSRITKLAKGVLKGSKISNDVFDILIAKCHTFYTLKDNIGYGGSVSKEEKVFLLGIKKYIRKDGIILIAIPYYRMHKDICQYISKYFDDVQVYKGTKEDWDESKLIYIYGKKSNNNERDEEAYRKLRMCFDPDNIPELTEETTLPFKLPMNYISVDLFKGSVLDMDELHDIVEHSGAMDAFFDNQKVEKIGESETRPLLPFNIGQVGLVLTSGCLDGVIDEGDGHYHLVKGKVSKKYEKNKEISNGVCNEEETISNRVEINVLLPNGEFKVLS